MARRDVLNERTSQLPDLPRRQRGVILAALAGITVIAWFYLHVLATGMTGMEDTESMAGLALAAAPTPWTAADFVLMLVMWWMMMAGMMLPGAAPMILTFATINRRKRDRGQPYVHTAVFASGYLVAWGAFSVVATLTQWGLEQAALLSPMMTSTVPVLGGVLFVAAGIYQWTPLKHACLRHCRSPFDFVLNRWRDGAMGGLRMGTAHGLYCVGCCWILMALLFVGGVMNLLWVAAIAAIVFVEKLFPAGHWIAHAGGAAMTAVGAFLLVQW